MSNSKAHFLTLLPRPDKMGALINKCRKNPMNEDETRRNSSEERNRLEQEKRDSIERNTKILREDLYQNYMKPYFKLG